MGSLSIWHWLIVLVVAMLFFGGRGKISELMGDVAKGINSFKKGLKEDETAVPAPADPTKNLDHRQGETASAKPADAATTAKPEEKTNAG
ncbi:MAG: twin-arginine translocase TatA/TatE family subunit [Ancalomicrobiaceae bacterium]|nr:twin-arginine translocase TatA/TatE family subunit [Ancalomicrobiaceae bacterium]